MTVSHHDAADDWAERRKIERHPVTGAAQLVEIPCFTRYRVLADQWRLYDASAVDGPQLVATGGTGAPIHIGLPETWRRASEGYVHGQ